MHSRDRRNCPSERATDLRPDEDDGRLGAVVADLLDPGVADVTVGDVVVDGEAEEEDVLKWKEGRKGSGMHARARTNADASSRVV